MQLYFVTGLPRCRTAWLSVLLSTDQSVCIHEPTARCGSMRAVREMLESQSGEVVGAADPNIGHYYEEWLAEFGSDVPIVIVDRDLQESSAAVSRAFGLDPDEVLRIVQRMSVGLDRLAKEREVLRVPFAELDDHLGAVWDHVGVPGPFPELRAKKLARLHIAVDSRRERATQESTEWFSRRMSSWV